MDSLSGSLGRDPFLSVIVPCFNEESGIPVLAEHLSRTLNSLSRDFMVELVLIDDGSTDATGRLLEAVFGERTGTNTKIIRHAMNRGLGAALRSGFNAATGGIVCTIDSDCTYPPERIGDLVGLLKQSGADIVTASPYHPQADPLEGPRWRLLLSKSASMLYAAILPVKLYCYTSLFRAYRREWARAEFFQSDGFLAVTEILVAAALRGAKIIEYPMSLSARRYGQSKMKVARTTLAHLRLMARVALRRGQFSRSEKMRNTVLESDPGGGRGNQDLNRDG